MTPVVPYIVHVYIPGIVNRLVYHTVPLPNIGFSIHMTTAT